MEKASKKTKSSKKEEVLCQDIIKNDKKVNTEENKKIEIKTDDIKQEIDDSKNKDCLTDISKKIELLLMMEKGTILLCKKYENYAKINIHSEKEREKYNHFDRIYKEILNQIEDVINKAYEYVK